MYYCTTIGSVVHIGLPQKAGPLLMSKTKNMYALAPSNNVAPLDANNTVTDTVSVQLLRAHSCFAANWHNWPQALTAVVSNPPTQAHHWCATDESRPAGGIKREIKGGWLL